MIGNGYIPNPVNLVYKKLEELERRIESLEKSFEPVPEEFKKGVSEDRGGPLGPTGNDCDIRMGMVEKKCTCGDPGDCGNEH